MITIKSLADKLGVSDQTIRNEIQRQEIQITKVRNSKTKAVYVLENVDAASIEAAILDRRKPKRKPNLENNSKLESQNQRENQTLEFSKQIENLESKVEDLAEQLEKANAALREKEEAIRQKENELEEQRAKASAELKEKNEEIQRVTLSYTERLLNLEESHAEQLRSMTVINENISVSLRAEQAKNSQLQLRIEQHDERSWWRRLFGIRKREDGDQGEV